MGALDGVEIVEGEGSFRGLYGVFSAVRSGDAAVPKLLWDFLYYGFLRDGEAYSTHVYVVYSFIVETAASAAAAVAVQLRVSAYKCLLHGDVSLVTTD